jgi:outer membrane protein insertion porin family
LGTERNVGRKAKADIFYEYSIVKTFEVKPDIVLIKEDTGTLAISGIRPSIMYDTRDNAFDPKKGVFAGMTVKFASKAFLSETDFIKLILQGSVYQKLTGRLTAAVSVKGGAAEGLGDTDDLPLVERFFLGGRSTVRGYEQDTLGPKGSQGTPTGGNAFFLGNLELRAYVGRGWGLVGFLDAGNVWRKWADSDLGDLKYTAGLGLRYNTPVGPLRLDYGRKLERKPGESKGELHFSIGHAF